jgi:hypothetical protein
MGITQESVAQDVTGAAVPATGPRLRPLIPQLLNQ